MQLIVLGSDGTSSPPLANPILVIFIKLSGQMRARLSFRDIGWVRTAKIAVEI